LSDSNYKGTPVNAGSTSINEYKKVADTVSAVNNKAAEIITASTENNSQDNFSEKIFNIGLSTVGIVNDYVKLPKNSVSATVWSIDLAANKLGIISSLSPNSKFNSYFGLGTAIAGTATAILGESVLLTGFAGVGLGMSINEIPIGDSTFKEVLSDKIWEITH
jgi:hypothetical protein